MDQLEVKKLFGENFIGKSELLPLIERLGGCKDDIVEIPISYTDRELLQAAEDGYILILGLSKIGNCHIDLHFLRGIFGVDPDNSEPCFYNQDWYLKENFMGASLNNQWYLIKKNVYEDSRAVMPEELSQRGLNFPSAILCGYTFFAYYFACNEYLWWHDFVWCCDTDHNGDRIYVGKYHDIDGVNKNGFSIHRHLALRKCYGSVNMI